MASRRAPRHPPTRPAAIPEPTGQHDRVRRWLPFWAHQLVEYALALLLVDLAVHATGRTATLLAATGAVVAALAAVSNGPLGALRWLPRRAHQVADLALAALIALSPVLLHRSWVWIAATEALALVLGRLWMLTSYAPPVPKQTGTATAVLTATARRTGRVVGRASRHVPDDGPVGERALVTGARGLGHLTNRWRRRGR